jgi:hypothetical protein
MPPWMKNVVQIFNLRTHAPFTDISAEEVRQAVGILAALLLIVEEEYDWHSIRENPRTFLTAASRCGEPICESLTSSSMQIMRRRFAQFKPSLTVYDDGWPSSYTICERSA